MLLLASIVRSSIKLKTGQCVHLYILLLFTSYAPYLPFGRTDSLLVSNLKTLSWASSGERVKFQAASDMLSLLLVWLHWQL